MAKSYSWFYLLGAIVFEVAGSTIMKASQDGWSMLGLFLMYILLGFSYYFLAKAVVTLPIGVAYAFWEGLGLTLITLVSVTILGEQCDIYRLLGLACVMVGTFLVHHGTESSEEAESSAEHDGSTLHETEALHADRGFHHDGMSLVGVSTADDITHSTVAEVIRRWEGDMDSASSDDIVLNPVTSHTIASTATNTDASGRR